MTYNYYTDGASTMKKINGEYIRDAGGWAFAQVEKNVVVASGLGNKAVTTNQEMELMAICKAIEHYL